jgi:ATP-dependent Clp protease adaptor protein ClpS
MNSTVKDRITIKEVNKEKHPKYKVILHNDDVNDALNVVNVIMIVMQFAQEKAIHHMKEAHLTGSSVLIVCELEHAEFYKEQLIHYKLEATVEKE